MLKKINFDPPLRNLYNHPKFGFPNQDFMMYFQIQFLKFFIIAFHGYQNYEFNNYLLTGKKCHFFTKINSRYFIGRAQRDQQCVRVN